MLKLNQVRYACVESALQGPILKNLQRLGFLLSLLFQNLASPRVKHISRPLPVGVMSATDKLLSQNSKQCKTESRCHGNLSLCFCGDIVGVSGRRSLGKTDQALILNLVRRKRGAFPTLFATFS